MEEGARQAAARGIRIRNCSKRSVIECFEKVELRDVLTSDPVFGAP
jgi:hypothetical protein